LRYSPDRRAQGDVQWSRPPRARSAPRGACWRAGTEPRAVPGRSVLGADDRRGPPTRMRARHEPAAASRRALRAPLAHWRARPGARRRRRLDHRTAGSRSTTGARVTSPPAHPSWAIEVTHVGPHVERAGGVVPEPGDRLARAATVAGRRGPVAQPDLQRLRARGRHAQGTAARQRGLCSTRRAATGGQRTRRRSRAPRRRSRRPRSRVTLRCAPGGVTRGSSRSSLAAARAGPSASWSHRGRLGQQGWPAKSTSGA
jgi:hypothetical protein